MSVTTERVIPARTTGWVIPARTTGRVIPARTTGRVIPARTTGRVIPCLEMISFVATIKSKQQTYFYFRKSIHKLHCIHIIRCILLGY